MLTASVLAKNAHVPIHTVRYYTRLGLLNPTRHPRNDYKIYKAKDRQRLRFIIGAKNLGFTLAEITRILDEAHHGNSPCPLVREIVKKRVKENRRKINQLVKLQNRMEMALTDWEIMEDKLPNKNSVCHLIESITENIDSTLDLSVTQTF